MNHKTIIALTLVMLALGCTDDATWTDGFDESDILCNCSYISSINETELIENIDEELVKLKCIIDLTRPPENTSVRFLLESSESYDYCERNDTDSGIAFIECMDEFGLDDCFFIRNVTGDTETTLFLRCTKKPCEELLNLTVAPDDNIRSATIDYNFGGKEWKYITILNATCRQIECEKGAYCMECEELTEQ